MNAAGRAWASIMSIGAYPGETDIQRGKRRIVVGYFVIGATFRLLFAAGEFVDGSPQAWVDLPAALLSLVLLGVLWRQPAWFVGIVNVALVFVLVEILAATIVGGGLVPSTMLILWGLVAVVGASIVLSLRAAFFWFVAYLVTLVLGVVLPVRTVPAASLAGSPAGIATTVVGVTIFVFAGIAYFVGQRDRFQRESDDLLHNILPDEITTRLKSDTSMIADDHESASVLFADIVDFTPMSEALSPPELVGLLNAVFTTFDGFVSDLELEKIKTVGDAYMVASGVPRSRPDHAQAMTELALRMRDHTEHHRFDSHAIRLRIGINSGPVVAGIVGTHKFAYDLWGDVVNTASRMESEGLPGAIQVTPATYELIREDFACEPRGAVSVKGKGKMDTYVVISRAGNATGR